MTESATLKRKQGVGTTHYSPVTKNIEKCTGQCAYGQNSVIQDEHGTDFQVLHMYEGETKEQFVQRIEDYEAAEAVKRDGSAGLFGSQRKKKKVENSENVSETQEYWDEKAEALEEQMKETDTISDEHDELRRELLIARTSGPLRNIDDIAGDIKGLALESHRTAGAKGQDGEFHERIDEHVSTWNDKKAVNLYEEETLYWKYREELRGKLLDFEQSERVERSEPTTEDINMLAEVEKVGLFGNKRVRAAMKSWSEEDTGKYQEAKRRLPPPSRLGSWLRRRAH